MKLNFKNKLFCLVLFAEICFSSLPVWALLQGNRILFVRVQSNTLAYQVDESTPESYFWIDLKDAKLAEMSYLSFWVKLEEQNAPQGVSMYLEVHEDTNGDGRFVFGPDVSSRVLVGRFAGQDAEKKWRKVTIPFSQFHEAKHPQRLLEMGFEIQIKKGSGEGKIQIDKLLFGSHYPEGVGKNGIRMQNRVSSFKIGNRITHPEMSLKNKPVPLALTLSFIDPYLEEIRFEESWDGGHTWKRLQSFYEHDRGGTYSMDWQPPKDQKEISIRAVGMDVLGGETELGGPIRISLN